jgi:hypothetical protein
MHRYPVFLRRSAIIGLAAAAAACHGSSSSNVATDQQQAYGVWSGTDTGSQLGLTGIVNTLNAAVFIRADGAVYTGTNSGQTTIVVNQGALSGQLHGYSPFGGSFPDGFTFGIGTLGGSVTSGKTLDGTWNFTTVDNPTNMNSTPGTTTTTQWALSFESDYAGAPTLSAIAGNYTDATPSSGDPSLGSVISISASGAMTAQAATTGCVLNGQVSVTDTTNQIYQVTYSYASCTGSYAVLNGIQFSGMGALNAKVTPATIVLGVSGQASAAPQTSYGLTLTLTKS